MLVVRQEAALGPVQAGQHGPGQVALQAVGGTVQPVGHQDQVGLEVEEQVISDWAIDLVGQSDNQNDDCCFADFLIILRTLVGR